MELYYLSATRIHAVVEELAPIYALYIILLILIILKVPYIFSVYHDRWNKRQTLTWFQRLMFTGVLDFACFWHQYNVKDEDEVMQKLSAKNCLLVGYHSRCTTDLLYFLCRFHPSVVVTHLMFEVPIITYFLPQLHFIPSRLPARPPSQTAETESAATLASSQSSVNGIKRDDSNEAFVSALADGDRPVLLLPGGLFECLQSQKYDKQKVCWKPVPGFVRLLVERCDVLGEKTAVVPFYTENCEKIYFNSPVLHDALGEWGKIMYDSFKYGALWLLPWMLSCMLTSLGMIIYPRPVKLTVHFGDALHLLPNETAEEFAARIAAATQQLIDGNQSKNSGDEKESVRVPSMYACLLGTVMIMQNFIFVSLICCCIWTSVVPLAMYSCFCLLQSVCAHTSAWWQCKKEHRKID